MEIPLEENKPEMIPEKNVLEEEINAKKVIEEKKEINYFEKINSPQLIQDILHLSSHSSQNDYQHQNNMIRSLYSFNDSILPILDEVIIDNDINFNPKIHFLSKRRKLKLMNFSQTNKKNDYLLKSLGQYNELKQKISDYKSNIVKDNVEGENNDNKNDNDAENKKKELNLKLFILNHPLINLFKEEIDTKKIKDEIKEEYINRMKDNSDYKPSPANPHMINVVEQEILQNEENDEDDNEGSIDVSSVQSHEASEGQESELSEPNIEEAHDINEGYNALQQNENNEVNNLDNQIDNIQEEPNLVNNEQQIEQGIEEPLILAEPINENNIEINNDIPVPPIFDIFNQEPIQLIQPNNPEHQLHPNLPEQPLPYIIDQEPLIIVNEPIPHNEFLPPMIENINVDPVPPIPEHLLNNIEENFENPDVNQQDENNNNENDKKENEEEEKKDQ